MDNGTGTQDQPGGQPVTPPPAGGNVPVQEPPAAPPAGPQMPPPAPEPTPEPPSAPAGDPAGQGGGQPTPPAGGDTPAGGTGPQM